MSDLVRIFKSDIVNAPIDQVWQLVRSFNGLPQWAAGISASIIENGREDNSIGCVRSLSLAGGEEPIREELLSFDEKNHTYSYTILDGPLPFKNYKHYYSTITLREITESNTTFIEWKSEFFCPLGEHDSAKPIVEGVYVGGINALKKKFSQ
ncbi:hypothetical protein NAEGRDRAFT_80716 [Naegleria gruberi]|uniref:SRPBCC family protein n=1 Tax=Naegleria gruberi TaxID=5762 RepID=D2VP67_NAEGR|nr:uncharacterized protein NAEGRDRAFT_80716 [Naegleria gruberi]EFC41305.1 hypothetical protein NAEGRDRAFT_80716 [Naegleria gruberi]|eukprot:XP_002674049.1 hypothetical protein NAEGRDRAFT_80716 [Naegleria gruberi strain NEG-M]